MHNSDWDAAQHPPTSSTFFTPEPRVSPEENPWLGRTHHFQFHGTASEYFGIWIVNILLMIVTFGLYAPWAKVRRLRYFYGNTEFVQRRFDFTGIPHKILLGRLIAIGIYVAISVISNYSVKATLIGVVILYLAVPWLIRATIRFNARNSKFGNARFYFSGSNKEAYWVFLKCIVINLLTLGLFFPVVVWMYKRYCLDHLYAGQLKFKLSADWPAYMRAMYIPVFLFIGILVGAGLVLAFAGQLSSNPAQLIWLFLAIYLLGLFFVWPLMSARIFITTWNNTSISRSVFKTDCGQWHYAWIMVTNWIVKVLSLGLMTPWAAIRLYRYQVESLSLHLKNDPDAMINKLQAEHSALAEEISDIFDIDVSL
ncbi:DUF898 domain-containing protein [Acinetobacter towneri]|uniref:YjgN family protein n=1 Tax=Acinetobacter towneri TaxID=202956 RepID=UPI00188CB683|nr:YjgN family protein [Acinetobacter towneri]MBF4521132.1 DUF898 domain-containing protein [Acinetobacter towneri]